MLQRWMQCAVLVVLLQLPVSAEVTADDVSQQFLKAEQRMGIPSTPITRTQALLETDLELKRNQYARAVELLVSGILAAKDLEKAQFAYEKSVILNVPAKTPMKTVMLELKGLRQSIANLQNQALAARQYSQLY